MELGPKTVKIDFGHTFALYYIKYQLIISISDPGWTDGQMESDAYQPTTQFPQLGSNTKVQSDLSQLMLKSLGKNAENEHC